MSSGGRRTRLESPIQAEILAALGAEHDLLLIRNSVGHVRYFDERSGEPRHVTYGLGKGSPDLVGILRGSWFCLEIKAEEGRVDPDQVKTHAIWRSFGAFIAVVRTVEEAKAALAVARAAHAIGVRVEARAGSGTKGGVS